MGRVTAVVTTVARPWQARACEDRSPRLVPLTAVRARSCAHPAPPPPGAPTAGGPGRAQPSTDLPATGRLPNRETTRGEHQVPDQAERDQREAPLAQQGRQVLLEDGRALLPRGRGVRRQGRRSDG